MIAACPKCGARYRIERSRLSPEGARVRCSRCRVAFRVRPPRQRAEGERSSNGAASGVREGAAPIKRGDGSMNGRPAVIMAIKKQPGADTRDLTDRIDQALDRLQASLPEDLVINANLFRQSHFIQAAVGGS